MEAGDAVIRQVFHRYSLDDAVPNVGAKEANAGNEAISEPCASGGRAFISLDREIAKNNVLAIPAHAKERSRPLAVNDSAGSVPSDGYVAFAREQIAVRVKRVVVQLVGVTSGLDVDY